MGNEFFKTLCFTLKYFTSIVFVVVVVVSTVGDKKIVLDKKPVILGKNEIHKSNFSYDFCSCAYSEVKKENFVGSEIQLEVGRTPKHEIRIIHVTHLLIKNFIFSLKKITFKSFYMELKVFFAIIQQT
jgi:hypothetical protein